MRTENSVTRNSQLLTIIIIYFQRKAANLKKFEKVRNQARALNIIDHMKENTVMSEKQVKNLVAKQQAFHRPFDDPLESMGMPKPDRIDRPKKKTTVFDDEKYMPLPGARR